MLGQKEDFTFLNWYVLWRLTRLFDDAQNDVTFQLIEELFRGIVMIVAALVRATDYSDHKLAVFPYLRVADGRLQLVPVFIYPAVQVEGLQGSDGCHPYSSLLTLSLSMGL